MQAVKDLVTPASAATTIAVLDDSELPDGSMKEVGFGSDGKVLLSKLRGNVHATSAFCTHYGAPLAKGTLESSGRVVCPWHGACFNVCTGDIEDAPAVDNIHSFKAEVKDGKIYVTATQEETLKKNMSKVPSVTPQSPDAVSDHGVVIVGGGAGALHTIESLRLHGYAGAITLISLEPYAPIDRTKLSKALITDPSKIEFRTPETLRNKYGVGFHNGVEVTSVDTDNKTVTISGSGQTVKYGTLVLAVGSIPKRLPVPGGNLENVLVLRQVGDAKNIDAAIQAGATDSAKRLVVVGSSFIGMELVAAVAKRGLKSVDVVGQEQVPFEFILGKEVGAGIMKFHEKNGVKFHMGGGIKEFKPSPSNPKAVGAVVLQDETEIPADVVVLGVGVRPATDFLKETKLKEAMRGDGGLFVNGQLQVKGFDDVYAIGDIAVYPQPKDGQLRRIEHWNVANNHGRAVGQIIGNPDNLSVTFAKVPIFWSAQGQQLRYCGIGEGYDDIIIQGSADELKFVAYYIKGNKIIAVSSMQKDPIVTRCAELLRLGVMPTPDEIRAGKDPLTINITTKPIHRADA
ncbi:hypothetical protein FRB96_004969 [Tulasnella sp. 330]|nr:hypothetical protein FRB96_004969 [Tulasnella sp. 330]KAG8886077.1 hypothetical protein FRB97_007953 [Tulasnella sp. 331]